MAQPTKTALELKEIVANEVRKRGFAILGSEILIVRSTGDGWIAIVRRGDRGHEPRFAVVGEVAQALRSKYRLAGHSG